MTVYLSTEKNSEWVNIGLMADSNANTTQELDEIEKTIKQENFESKKKWWNLVAIGLVAFGSFVLLPSNRYTKILLCGSGMTILLFRVSIIDKKITEIAPVIQKIKSFFETMLENFEQKKELLNLLPIGLIAGGALQFIRSSKPIGIMLCGLGMTAVLFRKGIIDKEDEFKKIKKKEIAKIETVYQKVKIFFHDKLSGYKSNEKLEIKYIEAAKKILNKYKPHIAFAHEMADDSKDSSKSTPQSRHLKHIVKDWEYLFRHLEAEVTDRTIVIV